MAFIYDLADTWSSGTTTFTGIKLNVTDSASTVGSLLMDLQVGGVSKFNVRKDGSVTAGNGVSNNMVFTPVANSLVVGVAGIVTGGIRHITGSSITLLSGSAYSTTHATDAMLNGALGLVGWHSSTYSFQNLTPDLALYRDAANTLAQRNGANNPQAFNIYNTYTDANNYERGFIRFVSNVLEIGAQGTGTGTGRAVKLYSLIDLELQNEQGSGYVHITKSGNNSGKLQLSGGSAFGGGLIEGRNTKNGVLTGHLQFGGSGSGGNTILDAIYTGAKLYLRSQNTDRLILDSVGSVQIATALTVATLPTTPLVGMIARVTDASSPTTGSTVAGGGAAAALCWYNGADWKVIGV